MPARKPPPPDEKPQRERFIETAREIGASEVPEEFERVFKLVVPPPAKTQSHLEAEGEGNSPRPQVQPRRLPR